MSKTYLPSGLPNPAADLQGPAAPFWRGLRERRLLVQACRGCGRLQWGPEYVCSHCHSFDLDWREIAPRGRIYSWERVWQAGQPALHGSVPYLVVLVELRAGENLRLIGNLLGAPQQDVRIGAEVAGVFEPHEDVEPPYALLQWRII